MDSVLSFTTLVAAIINYIWHLNLEGYLGVIIGIVIIKSAIEILKETVNEIGYGYSGFVATKLHLLTTDNRYLVLSYSNDDLKEKILKGIESGNVELQITVKDSNLYNNVMYNYCNRGKVLNVSEPETVKFSESENGKALDNLLKDWDC